jgi:hypothetical protein
VRRRLQSIAPHPHRQGYLSPPHGSQAVKQNDWIEA